VLPKPLQNSPKTTSADTAIFPNHQQPPFTSKNSHHVVPLIPTRCTQNSSQTIPKTTLFFPKNSTSFISKTTQLYLQNSTETTMKTPQKRCKKRPIDATAIRRRRPQSRHLRRRRSSSSPATCRRRLHHAPHRHRLHISMACALKP